MIISPVRVTSSGLAGLLKVSLPLVCACLVVSSGGGASAAAPKKLLGTFEPTVKAVSANTITVITGRDAGTKTSVQDEQGKQVTLKATNLKTYTLEPETTITVDGLPSKLADVKPGMKVSIREGTDPSVAESIVANTVPPPAPTPKPTPKSTGKPTTLEHLKKITSEQEVLSVTKDRITVAEPGADKAVAYFIAPITDITVNGAPGAIDKVRRGMRVTVTSMDGTTASVINAQDVPK